MTPDQIAIATALNQCVMRPASFEKRFARAMCNQAKVNPKYELTEKQAALLLVLARRYRRQIAKQKEREKNENVG